MEGSGKKGKGAASARNSLALMGTVGDGKASIETPPGPSDHPPHKGEGLPEQASYFAKPTLDDMGPGTDTATPLFRRNTLDEMTVGRTEKPVDKRRGGPEARQGDEKIPLPERPPETYSTKKRFSPLMEGQPERGPADDPRPIVRGKVGAGSYEDPGEQKRKGRTKGKTGRPGR